MPKITAVITKDIDGFPSHVLVSEGNRQIEITFDNLQGFTLEGPRRSFTPELTEVLRLIYPFPLLSKKPYDQYADLGSFTGSNFAERYYVCTLKNTMAQYIVLSGFGTEVTVSLRIPFPHRLIKLVLRQTNNLNVNLWHHLYVELRRDVGNIGSAVTSSELAFQGRKIAANNYTIGFGEGFEYEATTWTLGFTGSNTNRIHPVFYVERLGL